MDVTPLVAGDRQRIEAYGDGGFRVSGVRYMGPIILLPDLCLAWSPGGPPGGAPGEPQTDPAGVVAALTLDSFAPLFAAPPPPEILLLGCGAAMVPLPPPVRSALRDRGLVVDVMDTGAACRTYMILLSEERRVAAALIPAD